MEKIENNVDKTVARTATITVTVGLNQENKPVEMQWAAQDNSNTPQPCKAMLLSLFDPDTRDTLKIDLWTQELQVGEMDRMMFHTLRGLADSYFRATKNQKLANNFRGFAEYFGEETGILKKEE